MRFPLAKSLFKILPCLLAMLALLPASALEQTAAEQAAWALARPLEKDGFEFRAQPWERALSPDMGKALRVQLFKGNEYRFCVAAPVKSGARLAATVLGLDGKPQGQAATLEEGWGLVLSFKPKATGLYVIAIRQDQGGAGKPTTCAVLTGYK
jgi:hypothetical protein